MTPPKPRQLHAEIEKLDAEIAKLEARLDPIKLRLKALKRKRRPLVANLASCAARDRGAIHAVIRARYAVAAGSKYGIVKELSEQHHLSVRQIHRIIKSLKCAG